MASKCTFCGQNRLKQTQSIVYARVYCQCVLYLGLINLTRTPFEIFMIMSFWKKNVAHFNATQQRLNRVWIILEFVTSKKFSITVLTTDAIYRMATINNQFFVMRVQYTSMFFLVYGLALKMQQWNSFMWLLNYCRFITLKVCFSRIHFETWYDILFCFNIFLKIFHKKGWKILTSACNKHLLFPLTIIRRICILCEQCNFTSFSY